MRFYYFLLTFLFIALCWLPGTLAEDEKASGFIPRLSDFRDLGIPNVILPLADATSAAYTSGADLAVWNGKLAFNNDMDEMPSLHVYDMQTNGGLQQIAVYQEEAGISNIVIWEEGIAYIVGGRGYDSDHELVVVDVHGKQTRVPVDSVQRARTPDAGSLLRLSDGRLLFADGEGLLHMCEADGTAIWQVSPIPVQDFVYYNGYIYFSNVQDMVTYESVYCVEYDEFMDVSYPRLYNMRLDGTDVERLTDCGVRGLVSQGQYMLYQNIDEPFVWPQGEMPEEWLYGVVHCYDANTKQHSSLGIDSADYIATPYGLVAWMPDKPDGEIRWIEDYENFDGSCPDFSLILYDWHGQPLNRLDAALLYWYELPWFVSDDTIWLYQCNYADNTFVTISVPLDGSPMDIY